MIQFIVATLVLCTSLIAEEKMSAEATEALQNTQSLLTNPAERSEAIRGNAKAIEANRNVENIAGTPENVEQIYKLAADVLANVAQKSGGDPDKMQKLIEEAQRNPAAFANEWTPAQKQTLKDLSERVPAGQRP